ncbi:cell division protein FtsQ/DivIB [Gemmobacter fulvus]|uniref:Cell division protein FtsQ n=1 Tax=Gemmobacter fulvus TaxID=2840474 RepID=A0A975P555_9RHOB|nr:cell division protein FtsQ/DivIB [Gemmobacter fulvus]QWK89834.1 cell division protein FtsQ/DivIB [Gemmobacter fulvus]
MQPLTADRRYPADPSRGAAARPQAGDMRRDPAPTRMAYRMQRLWLTPLFRIVMRVGLPAFLIVFVAGVWLGNDARRAALLSKVDDLRTAVEQRPEFMVSVLSISGASPSLDAAIRDILAIKLPQSSFDLDLEAARARIATLDAVAQADVKVKSGGVLEVTITERQPALIWRKGDELDLLDKTGRRVAKVLTRADRPDLPVMAGEGADLAAAEALALVRAAEPITPRLRGLVRMGERRWDLVLDRNQRILLPAKEPVRALERLLALDKAEDLLNRDIFTVDLRNQMRPTLRLAPHSLRELRRAKGIETAESDL